MSTDSPELARAGGNGLRERPFGRTSIANRSDALFTSRNRREGSHEEPNFITDSLNTSLASPSPARPTRIGKPRFAAGNGRTAMASARQAEQKESRINKPASPSNSPVRGQQKHALLRTSTSDRPLPSSASRSPARGGQNGTRTPSPRGRHGQSLISPVSNPSDASPPRGLAESYRRIQDEEFIAGQEGSGSDDGMHQADDQVLRDIVNGELPRHLLSPTPSSRRGSRRPTPQPALEDPGSNKGTPPRSHPLAEGSHDSSPFEEITQEEQEMMRNLSQHERDKQRVNAALDSGAQPFRKARKGTRLGAGLENLPHNDTASQSESASAGSRNSSQATDPSLNVPSGWGRKARTNKTWLDRVKGDERPTHEMKRATQVGSVSNEKRDSVAKWAEKAGEEVMDTIESDSFKPDDTEDLARPLNVQPSATASAPSTQPETVRLAFSKARKSKIDALREREAEGKKTEKPAKRPGVIGKVSEEPKVELKKSHKRKLGSNEPIGVLAPTVPKTKDSARQPVQASDQSRDLLRNLARATSASPSPELSAKQSEADGDKKIDAKSTGWFGGVARMFTKDNESAPPQSSIEPKVVDTPQVSKSKPDAKTPMVTGAWIDTPATKVGTEGKALEPVPEVKVESATPLETRSAPQPKPDPAQAKESAPKAPITVAELQETAPQLRTALADIVAKAKSDRAKRAEGIDVDETLQLDDSTIESLEDLLASSDNSVNAPTSSIASVETPEATGNFLAKTAKLAQGATQSKQVPQANSQSYSRLASRLTHLKTSITDAKEGVGSLQKRLSKSKGGQVVAKQHQCTEGGELHDFIVPCEVCGSSTLLASDAPFIQWQTVRLPLPRMWYWRPGARFVPTFTWPGIFILAVPLLLIAELIAVDIYSPPFYADKVVGYGVDIRTPRPPFVLAQLLWQHALGPLLQPIVSALFICIRAMCAVLDMDPGPFGHSEDGKSSLFDRMFWTLRPVEDAATYWRKWQPSEELLAEFHAWSAELSSSLAAASATMASATSTAIAKTTAPGGGWFGAGGVGGGWFGAAGAASSSMAPPVWDDAILGMDADEYL